MIKKNKPKIIFLVSEDKFYIYDFISKISYLPSIDIKLIVIQKYKESFKRKIILSLSLGILNCVKLLYQLIFQRNSISIIKFCKYNRINFITTDDLNNTNTIHEIKKQKADIIINLNVMKLMKNSFLKNFKKKLINFHPGILPNYRGLYSTFHSIIHKEKYFGITAHFIGKKIDDGTIIAIIKERINGRDVFDCYKTLYKRMLFIVFTKTLKNYKNKLTNKKSNSKIYKNPTFLEILKYKIL